MLEKRDGNWTQTQWAPAKNTHDGRVNTRIVGYGHGHGQLPANLNGYGCGYGCGYGHSSTHPAPCPHIIYTIPIILFILNLVN